MPFLKRPDYAYIILPLAGICIFILLYIVAAILYPGGSEYDGSAKGFSCQNNYWCELLNSYAENKEVNSARPVAIIAMAVLALRLVSFWYHIPKLFNFQSYLNITIRSAGIFSMAVLPFLFTGSHDAVINIAGVLGITSMIIVQAGLFKIRFYSLFFLGIICIILCLVNNYIYYTKNGLPHLPVIQKITFIFFLSWFVCLNLQLYKKLKPSVNRIQSS